MTQGEMFTEKTQPEPAGKANLRGVFCPYCGGEVEKIKDMHEQLPNSRNGERSYQQIVVRCLSCTRKAHVLANARTTAFCPDCGKYITHDHGCGCTGKGG